MSEPATSTIADLLSACASGDQLAWSKLVGLYAGLVYAVARKHSLPEEQCDDIAQVVFAQLLRNISAIREPAALPGWLAQTTRRACWRHIQRTRQRYAREHASEAAETAPAADSPIAPDLLSTLERAHALRLALDELGGRCKDLLRALFIETAKPDYTAISNRFGMPIGSIGPTRNRCLAKLKELLPSSVDDER